MISFKQFIEEGRVSEVIHTNPSIETLKSGIVKYIEVEIILSDYYEKITTFYDMEKILLPLNYKLYHIQDIISKDGGQIQQLDALYKLK